MADLRHSDWVLLSNLLSRIIDALADPKFRRLKRSTVSHIESRLLQLGFRIDGPFLKLDVPTDESACELQRNILTDARKNFQAMADESLDPDTITFGQVADILKRDGKLPLIRHDILDEPFEESGGLAHETTRPAKPWDTIFDS